MNAVVNSSLIYEIDSITTKPITPLKRNKQQIIDLLKKRIDMFRMIEKRIINRGEKLPIDHMKSPPLIDLLRKKYKIEYECNPTE